MLYFCTYSENDGFDEARFDGPDASQDNRQRTGEMISARRCPAPSCPLAPVRRGEGWGEGTFFTSGVTRNVPSPYPSPLRTGARGPERDERSRVVRRGDGWADELPGLSRFSLNTQTERFFGNDRKRPLKASSF